MLVGITLKTEGFSGVFEIEYNLICLAASSETSVEWTCEDQAVTQCLGGSFLCSQTNHFTNYALLLVGEEENSTEGESGESESTPYLFIGIAIGVAVVLVIIGGVSVFVWKRYEKKKEDEDMYLTS